MKKAEALAIEVLLEAGLIIPCGSFYQFKDNLPVETRVLEESRELMAVPDRLPWLDGKPIEGDYMPTTKQGRAFCAVKLALGLDWRDRAYDKIMWKRSARALNQLISCFEDERECGEFILQFGEEMKESGIENWGIDAVVRKAANTKGLREQMK